MKLRGVVVAAILSAVPSGVCAFFNAEARKVSDFDQICRAVVIAPLSCPAKVDCLWLERQLASEIREESKLRVVDAAQVRQKMFDLGLESTSPGLHEKMLEAFQADAAVIATIGGVQSNAEGTSAGFWSGAAFFTIQDEHRTGQASLVFISKDGRRLLEGQGNGESHNPDRTEKGLIAKVFRLIVEKAF